MALKVSQNQNATDQDGQSRNCATKPSASQMLVFQPALQFPTTSGPQRIDRMHLTFSLPRGAFKVLRLSRSTWEAKFGWDAVAVGKSQPSTSLGKSGRIISHGLAS